MKYIYTIILLALCLSLTAQDYLQKGEKVTDFSFTTIDGETINIDDLKGKLVYINFFATWCAPCMKELALMEEELLNQYVGEDFYFVAIGRGHTAKELQIFKEKKGFNFNIAYDTDKSMFLRFSEKGIPLNIIIDQEGNIIYKETGFSSTSFKKLKKTVKKNL